MAPITKETLKTEIEATISQENILFYAKTTCSFCTKLTKIFDSIKCITYKKIDIDLLENGSLVNDVLFELTGKGTVPSVFIGGRFVGGFREIEALNNKQLLVDKLTAAKYDYDLCVVGGGSGGLAAARRAATLGARVVLCDFVKPTPKGKSWGLGGTCVNVGCIPKKLMHQCGLLKHALEDAETFGWNVPPKDVQHKWEVLVGAIQDYIGSLNFGYRVALREDKVLYKNVFASILDSHTVQMEDKSKKLTKVTTDKILIATGERPRYLGIKGDEEHCITSDDLFSLPYCPGKTLVVGASYVALECAGFLTSLGLHTTVMVRSILLRGFDQQMAENLGQYMESHDTNFIRGCIPTAIACVKQGQPGLYKVTGKYNDGEIFEDTFNTIIIAVGREPHLDDVNLSGVGVKLNKNGKIICDAFEETSQSGIYAIGDVVEGRPELTPSAIQAGRLLSERLFGGGKIQMDYTNIATTVFTPLEYGAVGLSEEAALALYGEDDIEVFHNFFKPLEWTISHREDNACYVKLICVPSKKYLVVGLHINGPNAGEITQGFSVAIKMGATKQDFDNTVGIHPTCAEIFTTLETTKRSKKDPLQTGC